MSWPMQNAGQWHPGMAMAHDMNMGSYTPEQWAAMQQQNWQQWTQWQQQYAQWQNQYGEKYAEQMQAMQAMGGLPPLPPPTAAPPPAPPPPDKPPPPPHENNQPLYSQISKQPAPVPAPATNQNRNVKPANNVNMSQGANNSNWPVVQEPTLSSVNAEALKKLAEEERLFDIQFLKWEEEIEKWRKDNVNHPDKQAYKEYEEKFESCRAQLLERRQQMNRKKARLLGIAPPPPPAQPSPQGNISTIAPPISNTQSNVYPNKQPGYDSNTPTNTSLPQHNYLNNSSQNTLQQSNFGSNTTQSSYRQNYENNSTQITNKQQQSFGKHIPQKYGDHSSTQYQIPQYNVSQTKNSFNSGNNNILEPQNRNDSYFHNDPPNSIPPNNPSFLLASESNKKGIPGLDLVPDTERAFGSVVNQDVIDITDDKPLGPSPSKGPDYSTISKGINNILGDEKIMNILSMVRGQVGTDSINNKSEAPSRPSGQGGYNNRTIPAYDQEHRNQSQQYHNQYDNRQNNSPYNRLNANNPMQQNQEGLRHQQKRFMDESQDEMQADQYNYDRNSHYEQDMGSTYDNGHSRLMPHGRSNMSGPNPTIRPLLQDMPVHQNENNYSRGPQRPENQGTNDYTRSLSNSENQERRPLHESNINTPQSSVPKWIDEPMFSPSIVVDYEHKPLRLKARDFIEPVHMFEYNHKSKNEDNKKNDFGKEEEIFIRKNRRSDKDIDYGSERYSYDNYSRDFERRAPRENLHDEIRLRPRDDYEDRRRLDEERRRLDEDRRRLEEERRRLEDRRRDDRSRYSRREDLYKERERDFHRDRGRDTQREDLRHHNSHERDTRKRGLSRDSDMSDTMSKKSKEKAKIPAAQFDQPKHIVMIDDLLEPPGREMRPEKIVIILRGPPGSGKSYLAKLIRDREAEHGGTVRIMSIDDYFMQEGEIEEKDPTTGKMIKKPTLKYEYDDKSEETYVNSLKRAFKRSLTDGYFSFIIYDAVNDTLKSYADVWNLSRQNDFQVYICTMELDPQVCYKRNIHGRQLGDIEAICARFYTTPHHHIQLDATTLLQSGAITEVQMEDADDEVIMEDAQEPEVESVFTSKWEKMDDAAQLARLDGTSKPLRSSHLSMEDYLQLDDWKPTTAKPGKKTVRWADIEESRQQEKMRAIGFVVGQTDWNRMTDPTMGSSALTQTKYIERVRRH